MGRCLTLPLPAGGWPRARCYEPGGPALAFQRLPALGHGSMATCLCQATSKTGLPGQGLLPDRAVRHTTTPFNRRQPSRPQPGSGPTCACPGTPLSPCAATAPSPAGRPSTRLRSGSSAWSTPASSSMGEPDLGCYACFVKHACCKNCAHVVHATVGHQVAHFTPCAHSSCPRPFQLQPSQPRLRPRALPAGAPGRAGRLRRPPPPAAHGVLRGRGAQRQGGVERAAKPPYC